MLFNLMNENRGIHDTVLNWFSSYLSHRQQLVKLNDAKSKPAVLHYGVPQGSVLGPFLFCVYMLSLSYIIRKHDMQLHIYADDTQLYCFFNVKSVEEANSSVRKIEECVGDIQAWMTRMRLKLNEDKTEFLMISSPSYIVPPLTFKAGSNTIERSQSCRNLGVIFDSCLNMRLHISNVLRISFFHLRNIGAVRKYITTDSCEKLVHAFVTSKLDYCNSLLINLPKCDVKKLQKVQNVAARIVTRDNMSDSIIPLLLSLHWLPIPLRTVYKLMLLTYKCLNDEGPEYLKDLLHFYQPKDCLRSASQKLLEQKRFNLESYGKRAFFHAAPFYWNKIPYDVRQVEKTNTFKHALKTYLYNDFVARPENYVYIK